MVRYDLIEKTNTKYLSPDDVGKKCLHEWMQQCLEWCFDRYEDGKFADQKYLDSWPEKFKNHLVISKNLGVGIAPWNIQDENIFD